VAKEFWAEVRAVWPDYRAQFGVNHRLREQFGVTKWFEHRPIQQRFDINRPGLTISEPDRQDVRSENRYLSYGTYLDVVGAATHQAGAASAGAPAAPPAASRGSP